MLVMQSPLAWAARLVIVLPVVWMLLRRHFGIPMHALLQAATVPFAVAALAGLLLRAGLPRIMEWSLPPLGTLAVGGTAGALMVALFSALLFAAQRFTAERREVANAGVRPS
jgi:uncharacterized transporter YbjL